MAFKHFWVQYKLGKQSDQAYIKAESFVIGRAPDCELPIPTDILSRRHLKVYLEEDKIFIKDLGSTNGTYLKGQALTAHEKFEYVTGDKLYLDAGKECSIRITAIFQKDILDQDLQQKAIAVQKKKQEIMNKSQVRHATPEHSVHNFVDNASESVDNIFDNLMYLAKSARYNKEKKIREAENQSNEMIEKAKREIEKNRSILEKELLTLKVKTKNEANRVITEANEMSEKIIRTAESKAKTIKQEADLEKNRSREEAEAKKLEIIEKAEEKHGKIIAEAYLENTRLKDEIETLGKDVEARRDQQRLLEDEIIHLKSEFKKHENLTQECIENYERKRSDFDSLKAKVENLEARNQSAINDIEVKIPGLEKRLGELNEQIFSAEVSFKKKETEIDNIEIILREKRELLEKNREKAEASEKRLDELAKRLSEAEDNLFKISKVRQQRNEELDREINERRERQKQKEEKILESINQKKEKSDNEIAANLASAKKQAHETIDEAEKEAKAILMDAKEDAANFVEEARQEARVIVNEAKDRAAEELSQAKIESDTIIRTSQMSQSDMQEKIDTELTKAMQECEALREEARTYDEKTRLDADDYHRKLYQEADAREAKIRNEAESYSQQMRESADEYAKKIRSETELEISSKRKDFDLQLEEEKMAILSTARNEANTIIERSQNEGAAIVAKFQEKADQILAEAKGQASHDMESLQEEIQERKKATDREIHEIRSHAVKKMEEQKKDFEKEEQERMRLRVLRLRKELHEVLRARITPFLKDEDKIEKVDQIVNRSISSIMLDEVNDENFDAENYSDIDPSRQQGKVKKFWAMAGVSSFVLILLFVFSNEIKDSFKESGRSIAKVQEELDQQQIEKAQRENDLSAEFKPDIVDEYFDSYTERVIRTKNYMKLEQDAGFTEQWRIELEEFFVDKLRLSESKMVPFLAREKALIKELIDARAKINGNFEEQGRARMAEIEADFIKRIKQDGLNQNQVNQIMTFKKKFFNDNKKIFAL